MKNVAPPNWFDFLVLVVVAVGILRGRKRGMSEEFLDLLMWCCIVGGGAFVYKPIGNAIAGTTGLDFFLSYTLAYALAAIVFKLCFAGIKRAVGEKLVQSDTFGNLEYYLGMIAGAIRFTLILIFTINFLHAKYISDAERAATAKLQQDNFGSISFPTIGSLQHGIFYESPTGTFIRQKLKPIMIEPVGGSGPPRETIGKRRERAVDEVLGK